VPYPFLLALPFSRPLFVILAFVLLRRDSESYVQRNPYLFSPNLMVTPLIINLNSVHLECDV
jgi:hypothetical protein